MIAGKCEIKFESIKDFDEARCHYVVDTFGSSSIARYNIAVSDTEP